jgi:hypothetical protein
MRSSLRSSMRSSLRSSMRSSMGSPRQFEKCFSALPLIERLFLRIRTHVANKEFKWPDPRRDDGSARTQSGPRDRDHGIHRPGWLRGGSFAAHPGRFPRALGNRARGPESSSPARSPVFAPALPARIPAEAPTDPGPRSGVEFSRPCPGPPGHTTTHPSSPPSP